MRGVAGAAIPVKALSVWSLALFLGAGGCTRGTDRPEVGTTVCPPEPSGPGTPSLGQPAAGGSAADGLSSGPEASAAICPPCPVCPTVAPADVISVPLPTGEAVLPEKSSLYHLAEQYEPVSFSHSNHVSIEGRCEVCHHHSSGIEKTPPCRECHGQPSGKLNQPGLKGAYHRQCMNCHRQMGGGPLGCEDCHAERKGAPVDQTKLALESLPPKMKLGHLAHQFGGVLFDHASHASLADGCAECHHHEKGVEHTPPCRECHDNPEKLKTAYHRQCLGCHKANGQLHQKRIEELHTSLNKARAAGDRAVVESLEKDLAREEQKRTSPLSCGECHQPKAMPATVKLGDAGGLFGQASFDHEMHTQVTPFCTDCHHSNKGFNEIQSCVACHGGEKPTSEVGLKAAYHTQCIGCHSRNGAPEECTQCHQANAVPETVSLGELSDSYKPAEFSHKSHIGSFPQCTTCHHKPQSYDGLGKCSACHLKTPAENAKPSKLEDAFHNQCQGCHKKDDQGPTGCEDCHQPKS